MQTFERAPDGTLLVNLLGGEVAMMQMLLTEVRGLVLAPDTNAAQKRLFPRAYLDPTEEEAEAELQSLVHGDLVRDRVAAFDDVDAMLRGGTHDGDRVQLALDADRQDHFLRAVNDLRLSLAALVGVDGSSGAETNPDPQAAALLDWLGELVQDLVELLLSEL